MAVNRQDELRTLRERVYGPNSAIQDDSTARRRLAELEHERLGSSTAQTHTPAEEVTNANDDEPTVDHLPSKNAAPRAANRWLLPLAWGASILIAAAVGVGISAVTIPRPQVVAPVNGTVQIARLRLDPNVQIVSFLGSEGITPGFSEFHGLRILLSPTVSYTGLDATCLVAVNETDIPTATSTTWNGPIYGGNCAANAFPSSIVLTVTSGSPEELRRAYPVGTALQFLYDEATSEVVVFSSAAGEQN